MRDKGNHRDDQIEEFRAIGAYSLCLCRIFRCEHFCITTAAFYLQADAIKDAVFDGIDESDRFLDLGRGVEQGVQRPKRLEDMRVVEPIDVLEENNIAI
ncbi:hypothetical protein D9M69_432580 [compost metagenome]